MIANRDKFQAIVLGKFASSASFKLNIYDNSRETAETVKLLCVELDHQLKFYKHVSILCSKAVIPLNVVSRLRDLWINWKSCNDIHTQILTELVVFCSYEFSQNLKKIKNVDLRNQENFKFCRTNKYFVHSFILKILNVLVIRWFYLSLFKVGLLSHITVCTFSFYI